MRIAKQPMPAIKKVCAPGARAQVDRRCRGICRQVWRQVGEIRTGRRLHHIHREHGAGQPPPEARGVPGPAVGECSSERGYFLNVR